MCQMVIFTFPYLKKKSKFYALYNGENHCQIGELVVELHVFDCGGTTYCAFKKIALNVEGFCVKTYLRNYEP